MTSAWAYRTLWHTNEWLTILQCLHLLWRRIHMHPSYPGKPKPSLLLPVRNCCKWWRIKVLRSHIIICLLGRQRNSQSLPSRLCSNLTLLCTSTCDAVKSLCINVCCAGATSKTSTTYKATSCECAAGYFASSSNPCVPCDYGFYREADSGDQTTCKRCPTGTTTLIIGQRLCHLPSEPDLVILQDLMAYVSQVPHLSLTAAACLDYTTMLGVNLIAH